MNKIVIRLKALLGIEDNKVKIEISDNGVMSVKSSEYFRHPRAHELVDQLKAIKIHKSN